VRPKLKAAARLRLERSLISRSTIARSGREGRLKLGTRGCQLATLIYRRDIANNAPDRITVRVIASERHPQNVGLFLVQTREVAA
jgi:hypothetical protein